MSKDVSAIPEPAFALDRRGFLKTLSGGLLIVLDLGLADNGRAQESGLHGAREQIPRNIGAWLHIDPDGITAYTGKAEVGQNIRTSLTQAIADELRCAPGAIRLVMADTALVPWDMGTFGSRTTPAMAPQLRKMAASARETLVGIAARKWNVERSKLAVVNGCVLDETNGGKQAFGELARGLDWTKIVSRDDPVTPPGQWKVAGQNLAKVNAAEIVTGKHKYTSDLKRAGLLHGCVLRPPARGAELESLNTEAAERIPGVKVIRDADFTGVAAPNRALAQEAMEALQAKWKLQPQISSHGLFPYLKANPEGSEEDRGGTRRGSLEEGRRVAEKTVAATYTVAYIAHVPLEPRAAVAEWNGADLTVWTGTQTPFGVRSELGQAFGLSEERVRVIVPDTGSAYGGKHTAECAIEAARLAKAAQAPVKLIWTREEEFTWAYFRPAGVIEVSGSARKDGALTAWEFHNYNSGPSGIQTPYEVANQVVHFHPTKSPLRQGSYRGLAGTANHFARESHMDEIAVSLGLDPLDFRLRNLKHERMRAALTAAADRFGWSKRKPATGRGFGLSCGTEKGSYFGCCAEVSVSGDRQVRIERVVEAFECGAIVNPEHLRSQVEGAIVMGIGGALFEAIDFADGRILNARLSQYRVPRFGDVPAIETVLIDRPDLPSAGAGETPIMGIAPAIANAIYSAIGIRVGSLPILPSLKNV